MQQVKAQGRQGGRKRMQGDPEAILHGTVAEILECIKEKPLREVRN